MPSPSRSRAGEKEAGPAETDWRAARCPIARLLRTGVRGRFRGADVGQLYHALRAVNVPDEGARRGRGGRRPTERTDQIPRRTGQFSREMGECLGRVESDLRVLKWMNRVPDCAHPRHVRAAVADFVEVAVMTDAITFSLDGGEVEARTGESIWQVADRLGTLPHLC